MAVAIKPPKFSMAFLGPRYWLVWVGVAFLYTLTWLPFPVIKLLGRGTGWLLGKIAKSRVQVARRNFELCYPDMSAAEREKLVKRNVHRAGMAVFETAMGWWWPDWRIRKHGEIEGFEHVEAILAEGKGVFGLALHNMNLEFACRIVGLKYPSIAFYRKHNNPLIDYLQYHGRARSNKYMIHKRNARALISALDSQELCLYLPDQDYGRSQSVFVPFGGVKETATTTATMMFIKRTNSQPLIVTSRYTDNGYKVKFYPPMPELKDLDDVTALTLLNANIADIINVQPESYLWMHKRFKTRPDPEAPSLYK
ncbi:LpxL/LpxP family Kdo(2)-lipid IV(A) lauroyl/palmitoleoyl acyltransferase [Alteromonas lipolytica]|uniref:Lipid A biosynthesis acyltransferase n=1 Tax=Alteromonas lipolytica TaxID=1856405 RepID=A0A1E8FDL7_9ALTE|nr:LpxL/LpxP family Kdo(2)-lipid IV(A) lauroyl/palmitoleoyl acyltransferase [Alteromonas lipolytica]OFI34037.1 lipid A biosynthesis acyltransferase [Alteromonas lipolytica]GGF65988.1 lipid A biosynthesis lauroyltransferase [Alteromonas lipolytica]